METTPLLVDSEAGPDDSVRVRRDSTNTIGSLLHGSWDNPLEWSLSFKWGVVALLALSSFTVTFSCISVAPIASRIAKDLDGASEKSSSAVMLVTIWELGEAVGPLLIAPLSELYGRRPIYETANTLFVATMALGALSEDTSTFLASRALTGLAVAGNVLGPAVVGDLFPSEQRGTAMSWIMFAPLIGSSIGPAFSSVIAELVNWRAVIWIGVGFAVLAEFSFFTCFRETYKLSILRRKVAELQKESGNGNDSSADILTKEINLDSDSSGLWTSIMRPVVVFSGSGVLFWLSLFGSVVYSYFYVIAVSLPGILEDVYDFSPSMIGSAFFANGLGSLVGVVICKGSLDRIYIKLSKANNGVGQPEYRLPLTIIGVTTLPPAVALYGWCAELHLPLPVFVLSTVWVRVSMTLSFLPIMSYIVDAFGLYSASALTGVVVTRCLSGAFFPLFSEAMIAQLGYGWGFTVLAAFTLITALIPILLLRYGARWRQRSKYTRVATE